MSAHILHLLSPARWDNVGAIIGDRPALEGLREALNSALDTGAGGTFVFSSDGEGYALAVALENDMHIVHTAYAREVSPVRSMRETVPMRAVVNFNAAISLAIERSHWVIPWFRPVGNANSLPARHPDQGMPPPRCVQVSSSPEKSNEPSNPVGKIKKI